MFLAISAEMIEKALMNTAMGMGTVFFLFLFIMFIISLFSFIPKSQAKLEKKKQQPKTADIKPVAKKAPVAVASKDLMNDEELVAVITAAIYASAGAGTTSKDQLVVRSIRRAR